ncbi:membrane raft polarization [Mactra antiquata]
MMSASTTAEVASTAVDVTTAGGAGNSDENKDGEMVQIWRFIYFDMSFVRSMFGIFVAAELGLSLLALISVSVPKDEGCAFLHSSTYSYFEFTASSCFVVNLVWYFLYLLAVTRKLGFVRWDIGEVIWLGFYIFNYLIASAVIAKDACRQGGYKAAAAFGFLCFFVLIAHAFFAGRLLLEKIRGGRSQQTTNKTADDEENKY